MKRKTRKKINRSGKGMCDICKDQHILQEHHIDGRDIPNKNHPSNLTYICANCHNKIHYAFIVVEGWARTSKGMELFWHTEGDDNFTGKISNPPLIKSL